MCKGDLNLARKEFDDVIKNSEEEGCLGMKEITCDNDSS